MSRDVLPRMGPSPTPLTEYMARHPESSLMAVAKAADLHYDTLVKAERGMAVPHFVTLLKLQQNVGIPIMAWAGTEVVKRLMAQHVDPRAYNAKQQRYRQRKRDTDPAYKARDDQRLKRYEDRRKRKRHGEVIPPLPVNAIRALGNP